MKRTLLSLSLLATGVLAFGQRTWSHAEHVNGPVFGSDRGTDTIVTAGIAGGTLTVYTAASGFVVGNNNYEDKAKAQQFDLGGEAVVDELLFLFGGKVAGSGNANSKIVAKVWALDGTGTASGDFGLYPSPTTRIPGSGRKMSVNSPVWKSPSVEYNSIRCSTAVISNLSDTLSNTGFFGLRLCASGEIVAGAVRVFST